MPKWLGDRMTRLGAVMCEAIIHHYGRDELLRRLANPFWFQSFGAVMGMDWHSSGITTSVVGALKRGLSPLSGELGIHVCGGRGAHSRKTPHELTLIGERVGLDGAGLANASRLVEPGGNREGRRCPLQRRHRQSRRVRRGAGILTRSRKAGSGLEHDPERWKPVFGRDQAPNGWSLIHLDYIGMEQKAERISLAVR